jgi:phospholipid N-methyltransferase
MWMRASTSLLGTRVGVGAFAIHNCILWQQVVIGSYEKLTTIEGEAIALLEAIHAKQSGVSKFCSIISTINMLNFHSNFKVKFIKQQTNLAAHTLDRVVKS